MPKNKRSLTSAGITRETLELTPTRALTFLMGVGLLPTVRAVLNAKGYDNAEHKRGWTLIERAANRTIDTPVTDETIASAVSELDNWDEPALRLIRAGLTRHPEARAQVLQGIAPVSGPEAVINAAKILERLAALEETSEGRAALATLAKRGLDEAERERVAALVKTAKAGSTNAPSAKELESEDANYEDALLELREWFDEWSEIARLNIKRRDHLIRLGLAERRSSAPSDDVVDPSPFIPTPPKPEPAK